MAESLRLIYRVIYCGLIKLQYHTVSLFLPISTACMYAWNPMSVTSRKTAWVHWSRILRLANGNGYFCYCYLNKRAGFERCTVGIISIAPNPVSQNVPSEQCLQIVALYSPSPSSLLATELGIRKWSVGYIHTAAHHTQFQHHSVAMVRTITGTSHLSSLRLQCAVPSDLRNR